MTDTVPNDEIIGYRIANTRVNHTSPWISTFFLKIYNHNAVGYRSHDCSYQIHRVLQIQQTVVETYHADRTPSCLYSHHIRRDAPWKALHGALYHESS